MNKYSAEEKLEIVKCSLLEVAPDKVIDEITMETSITNDLVLDSIEIMDLLIKIREKIQTEQEIAVDIDRLLIYLFADSENVFVKSICDFMDEITK